MTPTRPAAVLRCPVCFVGMLPDELTCGRCARCPRCGAVVIPGVELRRECSACGRKRCPWHRIGPGVCGRWKPVVTVDEVEQREMFFGPKTC